MILRILFTIPRLKNCLIGKKKQLSRDLAVKSKLLRISSGLACKQLSSKKCSSLFIFYLNFFFYLSYSRTWEKEGPYALVDCSSAVHTRQMTYKMILLFMLWGHFSACGNFLFDWFVLQCFSSQFPSLEILDLSNNVIETVEEMVIIK